MKTNMQCAVCLASKSPDGFSLCHRCRAALPERSIPKFKPDRPFRPDKFDEGYLRALSQTQQEQPDSEQKA